MVDVLTKCKNIKATCVDLIGSNNLVQRSKTLRLWSESESFRAKENIKIFFQRLILGKSLKETRLMSILCLKGIFLRVFC